MDRPDQASCRNCGYLGRCTEGREISPAPSGLNSVPGPDPPHQFPFHSAEAVVPGIWCRSPAYWSTFHP
jgi:hypothetical protein